MKTDNTQSDKLNVHAVAASKARPITQIGALLVDSGKITAQDAERVMRLQKEHGLRFGDAALKLELISAADLEQVLSRQYDFPYLIAGQTLISDELFAAFHPFSPAVEPLRALRTQLMLRMFNLDVGLKHLAIVSPHRGDGRSYLAANLAVVFAQLGERTLLIDADLRNPRQHRLFNLINKTGLSTLLAGRTDADAVERITPLLDLSVLPAGPTPPNPQELLSRPAFQRLLAEFDKEYGVIILDTPAAADGSDAQTIAIHDCGTLMVVRRNRTPVAAAKALFDRLAGTSAAMFGAIINSA